MKIEPCPFCEERLIYPKKILYAFGPDEYMHHVKCDICGYESALNDTEEAAINAHNRVSVYCRDIKYLLDDREKREAYIKELEAAARHVLDEYDFSSGPFIGPLTELLYLKSVMEGRDAEK